MCNLLADLSGALLAQNAIFKLWDTLWPYLVIFAGFSAVIFVHELGHFMAAKWMDVRVERFAIGFFTEIFGFTRGETRYSFNVLPLGGYVKMLGQEDFDDKTLELKPGHDPRSFANKSVWQRMVIVSAGVIMNLIFAAILFVIVFMHGVEESVTTIGQVLPQSPAALAGLMPGDKVVGIDGEEIRQYQEIKFAVLLADPHKPLDFEVERDGEIQHVYVKPEPQQQKNLLQVGIMPATTRDVVFPLDPRYDPKNPDHLRGGDTVVAIDGQSLEGDPAGGIEQLLRTADGSPASVTVERPIDPADPEGPTETREVIAFNRMLVSPTDPIEQPDSVNILGLKSLVEITAVGDKGRAALGGLKRGDVILEWGPYLYPTQTQISDSVKTSRQPPPPEDNKTWRQRLYNRFAWNSEADIPVRVFRPGENKTLSLIITPEDRGEDQSPLVDITMNGIARDTLRIAGVQETIHGKTTPAAEAGIPAGAVIKSVAGQDVSDWPQLVEAFRQNAGRTVPLTYRDSGGNEMTCDFRVPPSLRTKLGITTLGSIVSIDDRDSVRVQFETRTVDLAASNSFGTYALLREALERNGGQPTTVSVRYRAEPFGEIHEKDVTLTSDSVDPWLGRIVYYPDVIMQLQQQTLKAAGPIDALMIGVKKTTYFVLQVYTMMQRMIVSRSVGVENMSGPVGIVHMGSEIARVGIVRLLFFLAIISANLAVINFLPLPIVDGGLMVFLIVEKIKGSPVSMRVQVATQVIGLCLIGAAFIFVTFQDIVRLAG